MLLDFWAAIRCYGTIHYIPHACIAGLWIAFQMGLGRYAQSIQRKWGLLEDKARTRVGDGSKVAEKLEKVELLKKQGTGGMNGNGNGVVSPARVTVSFLDLRSSEPS